MSEYQRNPEKRFRNRDCLFFISPDYGKLKKENEVV